MFGKNSEEITLKITHLCLANFFIDNHSYQENMLTMYHKKNGYEVEVIASLENFNKDGERIFSENGSKYYNENGIKVTRLNYKKGMLSRKLRTYKGTYDTLKESNPDIIFIHGCQFIDIKEVVRYVRKNNHIKIYVDNHADFSNSATNWISENILHKIIWRKCAKLIEPYTEKFYGVLPSRVKFLKEIYKVPEKKLEFLPMGADDMHVDRSKKEVDSKKIRENLGIDKNDFVIITGGKIDKAKIQTIDLINLIKYDKKLNVKLILFGSIIKELKNEIIPLIDNKKIFYVGWVSPEKTYDYFAAADLSIFPGRHSVLWEQAVAMSLPSIFKYWEGTSHVNVNGNAIMLYEDNMSELKQLIEKFSTDKHFYDDILEKSKEASSEFLYQKIAENSIKSFE